MTWRNLHLPDTIPPLEVWVDTREEERIALPSAPWYRIPPEARGVTIRLGAQSNVANLDALALAVGALGLPVSFELSAASDVQVTSLCKCPTLGRLELSSGAELTERGVEAIASAPSLKNLRFVGCPHIRDVTLHCLSSATSLESIEALGTRLSGAFLEHVPPLRMLDMEDCGPADLALSRHLPSLQSLRLRGQAYTDRTIPVLDRASSLSRLELYASSGLSDWTILRLASDAQLEEIVLSLTQVTSEGVSALLRPSKLVTLALAYTNADGLRLEGRYEQLEFLILDNTQVTSETLLRLDAPRLRRLSLRNTSVGRDAIQAILNRQSMLESLDLSGLDIATADVLGLHRLRWLRNLSLSETGVDDGIAPVLADMPSLRHVMLLRTAVGDDTGRALLGLPALKVAGLVGTRVSEHLRATIHEACRHRG